MGKLLRSTETTASGPPHQRTYQYDAADRLLGVSDDARGPYSYTYDALDNRLSAQSPQAEQRAGYDALNQLSALDVQPYTYDANSNRLDDGSRRYVWDAENRLIGIAYANGRPASALRYDGLGRRLAIVDAGVLGSSETRFLWCGGPTPCQARDGNNRVLSRYYPHGEVRPSLGTYGSLYYVRDQLGSVRALRTRNGQTLRLPDYDPWGESGSFFGVDFRFAGMYYHQASGLYLTPYRAYDPRIGRWLSRDPIGEEGGINLYGYVGGNPVNFIDQSGLYDTSNCSPAQCKKIDNAVFKAQAAANNLGIGNEVDSILDRITFQCNKTRKENNYCGANFDPTIFLMGAFNKNKCGLLESTILHEVSHSSPLEYSEPDAFFLENQAFGTFMPTPEQLHGSYPNLSPEQIQDYQRNYQ